MSRTRNTREKIAPGIYRDHANWHATLHVRGAGNREKRFPLAVSITAVQAWRERTRAQLLEFAQRGTVPGTFARDAVRYINDFTTHLASAKSRRLEVETWVRVFGNRARGTLKPSDVARVRSEWLAGGLSPKTVNNRCDTLRHLYRCLDGRKAWTPLDDLQKLHVHRTPMQFVSNETILAVDAKLQELEQLPWQAKDALHDKKARARFRVLVSTGRRPSEVMRTQPADVDLERRVWLPRDGKGGFSPGVYLNDDMRAAWELFIATDAWGTYKTARQAAILRRAGWPKDIKPYQARHTLGITLSEGGTDLDDIGPMMGHKRRETTRRHYVPVLGSRMQKTSEALEGRFGGWPTVQTTVQTTPAKLGKTRRKLAGRKSTTVTSKPE